MNRRVNLTKRVETSKGLRFCPVVESANGRIKPNIVMVGAIEEKHPEGTYYIEWYEGTIRKRQCVGADAQHAAAKLIQKKAELNARANGVAIVAPGNENGHRPLSAAIAEYLAEIQLTKKPKTYAAYRTSLEYFQESCSKPTVESVTRQDMLKFSAWLRDEKEQAARSRWNKFLNVLSFLKSQGIRGLVKKSDWPEVTEEIPEIYEREDVDALFAACDAEERLWFEFFLYTGFREQEVMHVGWADFKANAGIIRMTHKPEFNWTPKAYREREVPIPDTLVAALKAHRQKADKKCPLIFPTSGCRPKLNFLDDLKAIAKRAGLNPADYWLHKFRATFATWHLRKGVDLATVQSWLGHTDLASTMRYLRPAEGLAVREKVNATFA